MKRTKLEKITLLSTNNKSFTTGGNIRPTSAGLEPDNETTHVTVKKNVNNFGKKIPLGGAVLEESPNDFELCRDAPKDPLDAESYYTTRIAEFGKEHKEEAAMCKYSIAKILMGNIREAKDNRMKIIERCVTLLNEAEIAFNLKKFPVMFGVINTMKALLFLERSLHLTTKDYVPNKGVAAGQIDIGLKVAEDALGPLCASYPGYSDQSRLIEQALCRYATGCLLILQINDSVSNEKGDMSYEYAIGHLERALSLFEKFMELFSTNSAFLSNPDEADKTEWLPDDPSSHPGHIKAILGGKPLKSSHGACLAVLGCAYMNWREDPEASHIAFEYLSKSVKPSILTKESTYWVVAHHHLAKLILREPSLVNLKKGAASAINGVSHIDPAINHLSMALTSPVSRKWVYELNFQIGLAHLIRLYAVTDMLQSTSSIAAAMSQPQNKECVKHVENHLLQTLKGCHSC